MRQNRDARLAPACLKGSSMIINPKILVEAPVLEPPLMSWARPLLSLHLPITGRIEEKTAQAFSCLPRALKCHLISTLPVTRGAPWDSGCLKEQGFVLKVPHSVIAWFKFWETYSKVTQTDGTIGGAIAKDFINSWTTFPYFVTISLLIFEQAHAALAASQALCPHNIRSCHPQYAQERS